MTTASHVSLGGHVRVGDRANLGLDTVVHQGRAIGSLVMVGMGSVVTHDVPAFIKAYGNPCRVRGTNTVGMQRAGLGAQTIEAVERAVDISDLAALIDIAQRFAAHSDAPGQV